MYRRFLFPLAQRIDAETAHHLTLRGLEIVQGQPPLLAALRGRLQVKDDRLRTTVFGIEFSGPVGLAAGFDKNAEVPRTMAALGFSHVEVGTVTPQPQDGKPRPRIFRLTEDHGLINRLGFPNVGMRRIGARLRRLSKPDFVLGVNIGPNAQSVDEGRAVADYAAVFRELHSYVDYVAINISSPNTQGLRSMQARQALDDILTGVELTAGELRSPVPLLVKIAPDLSEAELADILEVLSNHRVAGIIATNTTIARPPTLRSPNATESGGLSGTPLRERSTQMVRTIYRLTAGKLPIVGAGGIFNAADAIDKLQAGASLLQLYSGMIYQGPTIVRDINRGLLAYMEQRGVKSVSELVGQAS